VGKVHGEENAAESKTGHMPATAIRTCKDLSDCQATIKKRRNQRFLTSIPDNGGCQEAWFPVAHVRKMCVLCAQRVTIGFYGR